MSISLTEAAKRAGAAESPRCTVLIVEDAPDQRLALSLLLQAHGYEVAEASNGEEAHDRLQHTLCDLMLTDVDMPHLDGGELIRAMRADPRMAGMPIVAMTGLPRDRIDSSLPADAMLFKPFDWKQLGALLVQFDCGLE